MSIQLVIPVEARFAVDNVDQLDALHVADSAYKDATRLGFLKALSAELLKRPELKAHSELVALGFWLRPAQITQMLDTHGTGVRKSLGLVVHYTPANVDTMFVYSWVCSLLMGNRNIVRLSQQSSPAKQALLDVMSEMLQKPEWHSVSQSNQFIYYDKAQTAVASALSQAADARVIWGGDTSVNQIRALPVKPRCRDISFADRYSSSVINAEALETSDIEKLATAFWRDIEPYQQQACSSPRVLYWLGSKVLLPEFLEALDSAAANDARPVNQTNEQLVCSQHMQAQGLTGPPLLHRNLCILQTSDGAKDIDMHPGHHILFLQHIESLDALSKFINTKLQTLSYFGISKDEWIKFMESPSITGIERIVPVGQALAFSPRWDGYDLLAELSRAITLV